MGLVDTVYVSSDVAASWELSCPECDRSIPTDEDWQTKSLDPCMFAYYLRHDEEGDIRLYLLDRPSDRRFWRPWTEEEIEESRRRSSSFPLPRREPGGGRFLPEAYLPQHRRQRFMGELPHQWVEIYTRCECGHFVDYWVQFTDGIVTDVRREAPRHGAGFYERAGGPFG